MVFQTMKLANANNPNTISEQNVNATFTLCPTLVSETGEPVGGPAGAIAYYK